MRAGAAWALIAPGTLLAAWLLPASVLRHHAGEAALLLTMPPAIAVCLRRPLVPERLPAHLLLLLALGPASLASALDASLVPSGRARMAIGLAPALAPALALALALALAGCVCLRAAGIRRQLPAAERGASRVLDGLYPGVRRACRVELSLIWFGLFRWRQRPSDVPEPAAAFPATRTGIEVATCWLTVTGFLIEIPLFHILLDHVWNRVAAWGSTGLHALSGLYLVGYAKSLSLRPTLLFPDRLVIRLGVVAERTVPVSSIDRIGPCVEDAGRRERLRGGRLFGIDGPNLCLDAAGERLLFHVDEPARLLAMLGRPPG